MELPAEIKTAAANIEQDNSAWDSERDMGESVLLGRPLLPLVRSFSPGEPGSLGHRRVARLCLFAARRVLPCWELYCDGTGPAEAIAAAEDWLRSGASPDDRYRTAAVPSFEGVVIDDCRSSDTSSAAEAAARLVAYILEGDDIDAMESLSAADAAIDQSPLVHEDEFRRWLGTIAIQSAFEDRELTAEEAAKFRAYDPTATRLSGQR